MSRQANRAVSHPHPYQPKEMTMMLGRRADSSKWEVRVTIPDQPATIRSTGKADRIEAEREALAIYHRLLGKVAAGESTSARLFKQVAEEVAKSLDATADAIKETSQSSTGHHKARKHVTCIRNCLIPAFGHLPIGGIKDQHLAAYVAGRKGRDATKDVSGSTIKNHNHSLQKVFEYAKAKGWITASDIRSLPNVSSKQEPRPAFEPHEYAKLEKFLNGPWVTERAKTSIRETRAILREYVLIAAATGMRPGTEMDNLTWRSVDQSWYDDFNGHGPFIKFYVSRKTGKTGKGRDVVAFQTPGSETILKALERLKALNPNATADTPLFARPSDGKVPSDLHGTFETCLTHPDCDLLHDKDGDRRSLYSLRHTYACEQLRRNTRYEVLEKQMGTSAKMLTEFYSSRVTSLVHAQKLSGKSAYVATTVLQSAPMGETPEEMSARILKIYADRLNEPES